MKNNIKKLLCGVLAAAVLVASVPASTVFAADNTATDATPEQEVAVKKPSKVTYTAQAAAIKVTIAKVSEAEGYQIQYATNKGMTSGKKTITTKKTTYTISNLNGKKTYYVRVRAYKTVDGAKVYSNWTSVKSVTTKQAVTVKKPAKVTYTANKKAIKVTIAKVSGATGYQIQYATNNKMTSGKKTITTKKTTYTVSKLGAKKTYYVRVRAYKTVDGKKVYSAWTSVKKVTTKK